MPRISEETMSGSESNNVGVVKALEETLQKVQGTLQPAIHSHSTSDSFSKDDGLDFLDVKNSLLLSYLIDLTVYIRDKNQGKTSSEKTIRRLNEMKVVLDKMRSIDKKLRYQIDKLMSASTSATSFAAGIDNSQSMNVPEDPLQFRPDLQSLDQEVEGDEEDGENDDDDDDNESLSDEHGEEDGQREKIEKKRTRKNKETKREEEEDGDGVYRAPRTTFVPYTHDEGNKQKEKEKRTKRRMRASELAQTLRAQYGEAPEQEDIGGGGGIGRQREEARRFAEREAEKIRYEESAMVRLTTSRKEKKERKRLLRQENSNISAISDLGNLVRDTDFSLGMDDSQDNDHEDRPSIPDFNDGKQELRYENGKRRREMPTRKGGRGGLKANNPLQAALYGKQETGKSKKKKKSRR